MFWCLGGWGVFCAWYSQNIVTQNIQCKNAKFKNGKNLNNEFEEILEIFDRNSGFPDRE